MISVVVGLLAGFAVLPGSAMAAALNWSAPMNINGSNRLDSLDCPTATLCVAGDAFGHILSSTSPGGGPGAWTSNDADVGEAHGLLGFSCPSTSLCLGVDYFGNVLTSTNPNGGAVAWNSTGRLEIALVGISCPSSSLCIASQQSGDLLYSTEPEAEVWENSGTISAHGLSENSLSCPSTALCVVADQAGNVLASTEPTKGAAAWTTTSVDPEIAAINCPSTSFCAAVDGEGNVLTTSNPSGGSWAKHKIIPGRLGTIECSSASFCVASDSEGNVLETSEPTGSAAAWTIQRDVSLGSGFEFISHISCASASFCVGVDDRGNAYVASASVPARHTLTVAQAGTGGGIITSSPAGINCNGGGVCNREFAGGTVVTLTATPHLEESFDGWSGGGCSGTGTCQIAMNSTTAVTANFSLGEASGTITPPSNSTTPPSPVVSWVAPPAPATEKKPLKCRRGSKKHLVHGKAKCVKTKRKHG